MIERLGGSIILEGQGFTGKTLQAERLAKRMRSLNLDVVETFHPGGLPETARIRSEILERKKAGTLSSDEEVDLFCKSATYLSRFIYERTIKGMWTISSRSWPSLKLYQGMELNYGVDKIEFREMESPRCWETQATILLDVPAEEIYRRIVTSGRDTHVYNTPDMEKFTNRRDGYLKLAKENKEGNWHVINGVGSYDEIETRIASIALPLTGIV